MTVRVLRLTALSAAVAVLSSCATHQNVQRSDREFASTDQQIQREIERMRQAAPMPVERSEPVTVSQEPWVDLRPMKAAERRLPVEFDCAINFKPSAPAGLMEVAQQISTDCGIPVRVTTDALRAINGGGADAEGTGNVPQPGMMMMNGGLPRLPQLPGQSGGGLNLSSSSGAVSNVSWSGPVSGLLDLVTVRNGLSWRYNTGSRSISIFHLDTKTFRLDAFPIKTDVQSVIQTGASNALGASSGGGAGAGGGAGGGSSSTAGTSQTTSVAMSSDLYVDIEATIKSFLSPGIGRLAVSGATGTVTVTDTPEVLERVSEYLKRENATLTKQIIFHTRILSISNDSNDDVGFNWDAVYESLAGRYGFQFSSPSSSAAGAGTLGASVVGPSRLAGTNVLLTALSQLGKVKTITSPSVTTLNLQSAPVQIARQIGFIQTAQAPQQSTGGTGNVAQPGGLTPGYVTVGFNMNLVPRLLEDDNEMVVQYAINISALNQLRSVSAAGTTIEFPDIDNRQFASQIRLRAGETLILHGFEQDVTSTNRSGMGSPFAWMWGGSMKGSRSRQAIAILITPEIMHRAPAVALAERP